MTSLVFGNLFYFDYFTYRFGLGFRLGFELGLGLGLRLGLVFLALFQNVCANGTFAKPFPYFRTLPHYYRRFSAIKNKLQRYFKVL